MGVAVSCDRCAMELPEGGPYDSPAVWEKRDDVTTHVCASCYDSAVDTGFVERTVYAVVGEENVRMLQAEPGGVEALRTVLAQTDPQCVCGMRNPPGAAACLGCGEQCEAPTE